MLNSKESPSKNDGKGSKNQKKPVSAAISIKDSGILQMTAKCSMFTKELNDIHIIFEKSLIDDSLNHEKAVKMEKPSTALAQRPKTAVAADKLEKLLKENEKRYNSELGAAQRHRLLLEIYDKCCLKYRFAIPLKNYLLSQLKFADSLCYHLKAFDLVDSLCYSQILELVENWFQDYSVNNATLSTSKSASTRVGTGKSGKVLIMSTLEDNSSSATQSRAQSRLNIEPKNNYNEDYDTFVYIKNSAEIGRLYCDLSRSLLPERIETLRQTPGSEQNTRFLKLVEHLLHDYLAILQSLSVNNLSAEKDLLRDLNNIFHFLDILVSHKLTDTVLPVLQDILNSLNVPRFQSLEGFLDLKVSTMIRIYQALLIKEDYIGGVELGESFTSWIQDWLKQNTANEHAQTSIQYLSKIRSVFLLLKGDIEQNHANLEKKYQKELMENGTTNERKAAAAAAAAKRATRKKGQHSQERDPGMEDVFRSHYVNCGRMFLHLHYDESAKSGNEAVFSVLIMALEALIGRTRQKGLQTINKVISDYEKEEKFSLCIIQVAWNMIANVSCNSFENYKSKIEGFTPYEDVINGKPKFQFEYELIKRIPTYELISLARKLYYFEDLNRCEALLSLIFEINKDKNLGGRNETKLLKYLTTCKLIFEGRPGLSDSLAQDSLIRMQHHKYHRSHERHPSEKSDTKDNYGTYLGRMIDLVATTKIEDWNDFELLADVIEYIWSNYHLIEIEPSDVQNNPNNVKIVSFSPNQVKISLKAFNMLHYVLLQKCPRADPIVVHDLTMEVVRLLKERNRNTEAADCIRAAIDFLSRVYAAATSDDSNDSVNDSIYEKRQKTDELAFIIARFMSIWHSSLLSLASKADRNVQQEEEEKSKNFRRKNFAPLESLKLKVFSSIVHSYRSNDYAKSLLMLDINNTEELNGEGAVSRKIEAISDAYKFFRSAIARETKEIAIFREHNSEKNNASLPAPIISRKGKDYVVLRLCDDFPAGADWIKVHCREASKVPVTLKDDHYPGCGIRLRMSTFMEYPVSNLICNQDYQFAFSYYDFKDNLLGVGLSSPPILLSLGPISKPALWAYFSEQSYNMQIPEIHNSISKRWKLKFLSQEASQDSLICYQLSKNTNESELTPLFTWNNNEISSSSRISLQCYMRAMLNEADMFISELEPIINDMNGSKNVHRQILKGLKTLISLVQSLELADLTSDIDAKILATTKIFQISFAIMQIYQDPYRALVDAVIAAIVSIQRLIRQKPQEQSHLNGALRYFLPCSFWISQALSRCINIFNASETSPIRNRLILFSSSCLDVLSLLHPSNADEDESLRSFSIDNLLEFSTRKTLTVIERTRRTQYEEAIFNVLKATLETGRYGCYAKDLSIVVMLKEHIKRTCFEFGISVGDGFAALTSKPQSLTDRPAVIDKSQEENTNNVKMISGAPSDESGNSFFVSNVLELYQVFRTHGALEAYKRLSKLKVHPRYIELCCRVAEECYRNKEFASTSTICNQVFDWLQIRNYATLNPFLVGLADETEVVEASKKNTFFARKKRRIAIKNKKHNLQKQTTKFKSAGSIEEDKILITKQPEPPVQESIPLKTDIPVSKTQEPNNPEESTKNEPQEDIKDQSNIPPNSNHESINSTIQRQVIENSKKAPSSRTGSSIRTGTNDTSMQQKQQPEKDAEWAKKTLRRILPDIWSEKRYRLRLRDMLEVETPFRSRLALVQGLAILKDILSCQSQKQASVVPGSSRYQLMNWSNFMAFESLCLSNLSNAEPKIQISKNANKKSGKGKNDAEILSLGIPRKLESIAIALTQAAVLARRAHCWRQLLEVSLYTESTYQCLLRAELCLPSHQSAYLFYNCIDGLLDFLESGTMLALDLHSKSENNSSYNMELYRNPLIASLSPQNFKFCHVSNESMSKSNFQHIIENGFGTVNETTSLPNIGWINQFINLGISQIIFSGKPQRALEVIERYSKRVSGIAFERLQNIKDGILGTDVVPQNETKLANFTSHGHSKISFPNSQEIVNPMKLISDAIESHRLFELDYLKNAIVSANLNLTGDDSIHQNQTSVIKNTIITRRSVESIILQYKRVIETVSGLEFSQDYQFVVASAYMSLGDLYQSIQDEKRALISWAKMLDTSFGYPEVIPNWKRYIDALTRKGTSWLVVKHLGGLANTMKCIITLSKIALHSYYNDFDKRIELVYFAYELICGIMTKSMAGTGNSDETIFLNESCMTGLELLFRGVELFNIVVQETNQPDFSVKRPLQLVFYLDFLVRQLLFMNDPIPAVVVMNLYGFIVKKYCNSEEVLLNYHSLKVIANLKLNSHNRALNSFATLMNSSRLVLDDRAGFDIDSCDKPDQIANPALTFDFNSDSQKLREYLQKIDFSDDENGNGFASVLRRTTFVHLLIGIAKYQQSQVSYEIGLSEINSKQPLKSWLSDESNDGNEPERPKSDRISGRELAKLCRKELHILLNGTSSSNNAQYVSYLFLLAQSFYIEDDLVATLGVLDYFFNVTAQMENNLFRKQSSSELFDRGPFQTTYLTMQEVVIPARKLYLKVASKLKLMKVYENMWSVAGEECQVLKASVEFLRYKSIHAKHLVRHYGAIPDQFAMDFMSLLNSSFEKLKYPSSSSFETSSEPKYKGPISLFLILQSFSYLQLLVSRSDKETRMLGLHMVQSRETNFQSYLNRVRSGFPVKLSRTLEKTIILSKFLDSKITNSDNIEYLPASLQQLVKSHLLEDLESATEISTTANNSTSVSRNEDRKKPNSGRVSPAIKNQIDNIVGQVGVFFSNYMQNRIFFDPSLGKTLLKTMLRLKCASGSNHDACKLLYLSDRLFEDIKSSFSKESLGKEDANQKGFSIPDSFSSILATYIVRRNGLSMPYKTLIESLLSKNTQKTDNLIDILTTQVKSIFLPKSRKELNLMMPEFIKTIASWSNVIIDSKSFLRQLLEAEKSFRTIYPDQCSNIILPGLLDIIKNCKIPTTKDLFILKWIVPTSEEQSQMSCYVMYQAASTYDRILATVNLDKNKILRLGKAIERLKSRDDGNKDDKIKLITLIEKIFRNGEWELLLGSDLLKKIPHDVNLQNIMDDEKSFLDLEKMFDRNGLSIESASCPMLVSWMLGNIRAGVIFKSSSQTPMKHSSQSFDQLKIASESPAPPGNESSSINAI